MSLEVIIMRSILEKELKEWINYYCKQFNTDFKNLSESVMLEIIEFLKEDGFSEQEINKQINKIK
jgi:hypothetical protein